MCAGRYESNWWSCCQRTLSHSDALCRSRRRRSMLLEADSQVVARRVDHACLLVNHGRVGSTWLLSMLARSPSLHVAGEVLSDNGRKYFPDCPPDTCGVNTSQGGAIDRVFSWMDRASNYTKTSLFKNSGPGSHVPVSEFITYPAMQSSCGEPTFWKFTCQRCAQHTSNSGHGDVERRATAERV